MRNFTYLLSGLILCSYLSCSLSSNKEQENVRILMKDSIENSSPQKMPISESKIKLTYKEKEYVSTIIRQPDEKQPIVRNQQGDTFIDNNITLHLTQANETVINRTFTKTDFASLINARFMEYAILEGLIYDKTTTEGFIYIASISYPQSDLYVPIKLTITTNGSIRMEKEELIEHQYTEEEVTE